MKRTFRQFLILLLLVIGSSFAHAQDYPSRVITMIVPFPPGGSTDVLGRVLAETMGESLGQQIIVQNSGGAGGTIGAGQAARSAGDGYTIFFHNMAHATAPALYQRLAYDPIADFEPIGLVADVPMILVGRKDFPAEDLATMISYAKANKEEINFAHAGVGSTSHLCSILFMSKIGTELASVPYRGTGPALNDVLGGQVDFICDQPVSTMGFIKAGTIKPYAVATKSRIAPLPEVPTFEEAGLPGFELSVWHGLYAPKGTPAAVVEELGAALQEALNDPSLKQRFAELGAEPVTQDRATPTALDAHLKAEIARWQPIIETAGVSAE
ncbi:MAG TPA: tripartite tricarboxylate transporter substrate binding protein BugD [Microvirga sp.]|nr:tripartite tricarboxylate transporter substrate binding protein BugD [Microvirga sp.]